MSKVIEIIYPVVLIFLFAAFFLFGLGSPSLDRLEELGAGVSKEMYLTGEPVMPALAGEEIYQTPLLARWAQVLGYMVFGVTTLGVRIAGALAAVAAVATLYFGARGPSGSRIAFHGSLILGSTFIFGFAARLAGDAMLLTLFATLALVLFNLAFERASEGGGARLFWYACLSTGGAALAGGVLWLAVLLLTFGLYALSVGRPGVLLQRTWLVGGGITVLITCYSWYLLLGFSHPDGFSFAWNLLVRQHLGMFPLPANGGSSFDIVPWLILAAGFIPWSAYLPIALFRAPLKNRRDPAVRILRLMLLFSLLVLITQPFATAGIRLEILPALPGLSLLLAHLFDRDTIKHPLPWLMAAWFSAALIFLVATVLSLAPLILAYLPDLFEQAAQRLPFLGAPVSPGHLPLLAAVLLFCCAALIILSNRKRRIPLMFEVLLFCSVVVSGTMFLAVGPLYDRLLNEPLALLARQAAVRSPEESRIIMLHVDRGPTVSFTSGRSAIFLETDDLQTLPESFASAGTSQGITTDYYFNRLEDLGVVVSKITESGGFVLFELPAADGSEESRDVQP